MSVSNKIHFKSIKASHSFFACGSLFVLFDSEASFHRLCQPLPLVFEPLEYPGAIDMEMEFVVRGVSLDLYLCPRSVHLSPLERVIECHAGL